MQHVDTRRVEDRPLASTTRQCDHEVQATGGIAFDEYTSVMVIEKHGSSFASFCRVASFCQHRRTLTHQDSQRDNEGSPSSPSASGCGGSLRVSGRGRGPPSQRHHPPIGQRVNSVQPRKSGLFKRHHHLRWNDEDVRANCEIDDSTQVIDLQGRTVIPGLIDAHVHPIEAGQALLGCTLAYRQLNETDLRTIIQACLDRERNTASADIWLTVTEFDREGFTDINGRPNATMLDALNTTRPILVIATNQHNVWVNTRGLAVLNITRDTPDIPGGRIVKDANGFPTGILEENASGMARGAAGASGSSASREDGARVAVAEFRKNGITSFLDALAPQSTVWSELKAEGALTARNWNAFGVFGLTDPAQLTELAQNASRALDEGPITLAPGSVWKHVKLFMDGVLSQVSESATLLEPYLVDAGNGTYVPGTNTGIPAASPAQLADLLTRVLGLNLGIGLHVHAVGDAAVRQVLDAAAAHALNHTLRPGELAIAHAELVSAEDHARFARLGLPAVMSYQWAQRATYWNEPTQRSLGPARMGAVEPHAVLAEAGTNIVYGSDWPVDPLDPFLALKIAVTREGSLSNPHSHASFGPRFVGRIDEQPALSRELALRGMTSNAATYLGVANKLGSLEVGKFADLLVLDRPYFDSAQVSDEELDKNKVLLTVVGGRAVFADEEATFVPSGLVRRSSVEDEELEARVERRNILPRTVTGRSCTFGDIHGQAHAHGEL
ncbi:unnamed protein product [Cyclocybe aegerita]|uniref:Amidohydrolase 3 domain-containing protein n=1 Tax=Cyclocybe aegerita TaxID=1973307 RepID=A0A8S0WUK5_CYCAE|nr:unnamed protein product [Cyclocybe aegerita]